MKFSLLVFIAALYRNNIFALASSNQHFFGPSTAATFTPELTKVIQQVVDAHQIPGVALAVVHKDGPPEFGTLGRKSEDGSRMTVDTLFAIASCSKAFLSTSLGILIDDFAQGRNTTPLPTGLSTLSWQTKLADILPGDWELSDTWASQKANLIDILTHVSGLPSHDLSYKQNDSALDITRNLRNLRPSYEFREKFQYNNLMYAVGAQVVARLSGMRLIDFVKDRIFTPLNMVESTYFVEEAIQSGRASETWTSFGRRIPAWMRGMHPESFAGPGGIMSNVNELTSWITLLLNDGVDPRTNKTIISPGALEQVTSAHSIMIGNPQGQPGSSVHVYGLGWSRFTYAAHDVLLHSGMGPGVSAVISLFPEDGVGVIALANADRMQQALVDITLAIARKLFQVGVDGQVPPTVPNFPFPPGQPLHIPIPNPNVNTTTNRDADISEEEAEEEERTGVAARRRRSRPAYVDLSGTYHNEGYGTLELCSGSSTADACQRLLHDFRRVVSETPSTDDPHALFASWPSVFTDHARFTPIKVAAGRYRLDVGTLYPVGYGRDVTPFALWVLRLVADFVVVDGEVKGFGFSYLRKKQGHDWSVERDSEVWFTKRG